MRIYHGETTTNSRLYSIWSNIIQRCTNPKNTGYEWYGARGITVCDTWRDYMTFKTWAISSGYSDYLTIDRIDVNGDYCPENCKWSTSVEQCNNRRTNRVLTLNGESLTISQWGTKLGIPPQRISSRLFRGWSIQDALTKPIKKNQYV